MFKSLILIISSIIIFISCSFNNPFDKESTVAYVDCPKTLILAPASKIKLPLIEVSLDKNYQMICYSKNRESTMVNFEFDYSFNIDNEKLISEPIVIDFWVFVTNKNEDKKIFEKNFIKYINDVDIKNVKIDGKNLQKLSYNDSISLNKDLYESGLRIFLGIN